MTSSITNEESNLLSFLPSNLISELDENLDFSSTNTHKETIVSHIIIYYFLSIVFNK